MNFTSTATDLLQLAGGSIPGPAELNDSQIWGVTIAGLGIVFAGLVLLVLVIWLFGKIFDTIALKKKAKADAIAAQNAPKVSAKPAPAPAPVPAPVVSTEDEDEVIAVISAVIAAMSEQDGKVYKLHSVKPAATSLGGRTAWAMDGRRQNVMPF